MDRLLEERRCATIPPVTMSEKKKFIKSRQAYNQSQQKLDLGKQLLLFTMRQDNPEHIEVLDQPQLSQIFDGCKLKFVVSLDSNSSVEPSGTSIYERPLCYDEDQCSYYLLKCNIHPGNNSHNLRLIQLMYILGDFCCVEASDSRLIGTMSAALKDIKPSWNKFNSLLIHALEEESSYGQTTTAYDTCSFPNAPITQDHLSEFSASNGKFHNKQMRSTQSGSGPRHFQTQPLKVFNRHFTRVVKVVEPLSSLFRTASYCKQYLMRGIHFNATVLKQLVKTINKPNILNMPLIQIELIKDNMMNSVNSCRSSYNNLVRTVFLGGKSLAPQALIGFLTEIYQQIIGSFDHEFGGLSHLEQYEIYRCMIRRYVDSKEVQINELNEYIHQNECLAALQGSVDGSRRSEFFNQRFVNEDETNSTLNVEALKIFLGEYYMKDMRQDIELMRQKNEKAVMHTLNYSQNPVQMLRYYQERVQHCKQKKKRLEDCLRIAERQLDISQNIHNGHELELVQQKLILSSLQQREMDIGSSPVLNV